MTPSSKVVGDMAQFMVAQKLSPDDVVAQAETPSRTVSRVAVALSLFTTICHP